MLMHKHNKLPFDEESVDTDELKSKSNSDVYLNQAFPEKGSKTFSKVQKSQNFDINADRGLKKSSQINLSQSRIRVRNIS